VKIIPIPLLILILFIEIYAQLPKTAFINGKIYTVDEKQPPAEAVVTQGSKIIFVGDNTTANGIIDNHTQVIDLKGKLMLPGFIDNHTHFTGGGFYLLGVNLRSARSTTEFRNILKKYVEEHRGDWITGGDWDHEQWETQELPTREMLDDFSPDTPIFVSRFDGHMAVANSYAMKSAGINKNTIAPEGGLIVRDEKTDEPTGVFKDNAMDLIYKVIPPYTVEQREEAALRALQEAKENGITSIQDITSPNDLRVYQKLEKDGLLTCRIYTRLPIYYYNNLVDAGIQAGFGSDKLKVGSLKGFADGSLGSSTALFFKPYDQDTTTRGLGMDILTDGRLQKWSKDADKNKLQLSIHAIGDSANYLMLKIFEKINAENPEWDRRFRIEHAQHVRFEDMARFAKLGVIASVQPFHAIDDGVWAEKRIGNRIKYTYSFKSFLDAGVKMCFGSDWTVGPLDALYGIYAAVTRRTLDGKNPAGWIPEQKISVKEAIKCYTINSAYAAFEEGIKGSIEVGKLADLVVLSNDILTIDPVKIKDVKVDMTVFDGKIIYERN
jgi:predicted amidohydrolase YtcJ